MFNICLQLKETPKECLEQTFSNLAPTFQIVAGATERKKDCMQNPRLKNKAHDPVIMEESFDDDQQQHTPFMPT